MLDEGSRWKRRRRGAPDITVGDQDLGVVSSSDGAYGHARSLLPVMGTSTNPEGGSELGKASSRLVSSCIRHDVRH
jgi:hypothetical protein